MNAVGLSHAGRRFAPRSGRKPALGFTLVEMLVVVSIVAVLMSLLFPAIQAARESARQTACKSNLRQFGIGLHQHAEKFGTYCSGACDWLGDGAVTQVGWVADLVNIGTPTGKMLCPSNPALVCATYNDLLSADTTAFDACVPRLGSPAQVQPDGSSLLNPCAQIAAGPLAAGSAARVALVQNQIYAKFYNTNYTASWWLVRSGLVLDGSGNLLAVPSGCPATLTSRNSTIGPLTRARADACPTSASFVPLLACGASSGQLTQALGDVPPGSPVTVSFTAGPVVNPTMTAPSAFASGTPRTGAGGWWATWNATIQDYRAFAPVHRGVCNILMADSSVQSFSDANNDHYLNNGFTANAGSNPFADATVELSPNEVYSRWSLTPQ